MLQFFLALDMLEFTFVGPYQVAASSPDHFETTCDVLYIPAVYL
jgi:hypothetical protein